MTRVVRSLLLALALTLALSVAPAAQAASPGVNLAGLGEVDDAINSGAKYARVFVWWANFQPQSSSQLQADVVAQWDVAVNRLVAAGVKPIFVVMGTPSWASGSSDGAVPPTNPQTYGDFMGRLAAHFRGRVAAYEIWNEPDETTFWHPAPDPAKYTALLTASYLAIKVADPTATVLVGGLTGNNYEFIESLYGNGAQGAFDGVAVHTDTACLDRGPESFYRDATGRIARFTFLGYRSVHDVMVAHGDVAKSIWMTELGWSSTTTTCQRGTWAGQKPAGVSEADQATFLKQAYHCLSFDPYVEVGAWFTVRDIPGDPLEEHRHYGLLRANGSQKPSWGAFTTFARNGDTLTGPCGDLEGPAITLRAPVENQKFNGSLMIAATVTDDAGVGIAKVTFRIDGNVIRHWAPSPGNVTHAVIDWQGARNVPVGTHTITVEALDRNRNKTSRSFKVKRVNSLAATLPTKLTTPKLKCTGRTCALSGRLTGPEWFSLDGNVQIEWQWKAANGRFKKMHGGLKKANKPFVFSQRLKRPGRWRVRVWYLGKPPLKKTAPRYVSFRVR